MTRAAAPILAILMLASPQLWANPRPFKVVIDPGHGGADQGTVFQGDTQRVTEKEVTLALAREAARHLRDRGFEVVLTRNSDRDLPLPDRTALANRIGADVFLSIHMNSTQKNRDNMAEGTEIFILNNTSDESSRRLAYLENSVLQSSMPDLAYDKTDVALILKDLRLDANLSESKRLACRIQDSLSVTSRERNRGVKQALFYVLLGADMPSALLEAGFLNSAKDRAMVLSPYGRKAIASSIARAIDQFRKSKGTRQVLSELSKCKVN
jgi:N-acetylmuramoyl-L-alanine amidase